MRTSKAAARLLRTVVAPRSGGARIQDLLSAEPSRLAGVGQLADFHGVAGYVRRALEGSRDRIPREEWEILDGLRRRVVFTHLQVASDLRFVQSAFDAASIRWAAIKGPVLAERIHGAVDLRAYSDLDVLVEPARLGDALDALEERGADVLDRNWEMVHRTMKGELHVRLPAGTMLDLHWHLLNSARLRSAFDIPVSELLSDVRRVPVAGLQVPTFPPAATIVYVALHTMLSGAHRLVWLKDLERLLSVEPWTADEVIETAERWGARLALAAAVRRTERCLGAIGGQTPGLAQMGGSARVLLAGSDVAWRAMPAEREQGEGSVARLVARSVRPSASSTLQEFGRRTFGFARDRGGEVAATQRTSMDPTDPQSILFSTGGERRKHEYLRAVAAAGGALAR